MSSPSLSERSVDAGQLANHQWSLYKGIRLIGVIAYFFSGTLAIVTSQLLIICFTFYSPELQRSLLNFTKTNFIILLVSVLQCVSPSKVYISQDDTIAMNTFQYTNILDSKIMKSYLDSNAIVIANHQIYIDWVYLWFFAYCNQMGNTVYIIMKESLKKIPIIGYGMKNYNFIFLSRKWEKDRSLMTDQLAKIDHYCRVLVDKSKYLNLQKYWIIIFPEGTNMSPDRLEKSNNWCDKVDSPRMKNLLFPRVKGLYFTTQQLSETTKTIYNLTIGYSGVKHNEFAQDIYTMKNIFVHGAGPKEIHVHFSRSDINDIENFKYGQNTLTEEEDLTNMNHFEKWLVEKWYQKDELLEGFYQNGLFGKSAEFQRYEAELKINNLLDLSRIFVIPFSFFAFVYVIYSVWFK